MRKFFTTSLLFLVFISATIAQTFNGGGGVILDDGSDNYYPINVSGLSPSNIDTVFGLETVCINLIHTWDDDLVISLIAPDGTEFMLAARNGGDGDNYTNTCFNSFASQSIESAGAPFTGTFTPEGSMSTVNDGQNGNGIWQLHILDTYPFADAGVLFDWSLTFGNNPAKPFPFYGTNLPLVVINTHGKLIPDDPKMMVDMKIINNGSWNVETDSGNIYSGLAGIELRGTSSGWMPKKSYNFETRHADSSDFNVQVLGMPSESDWILIANYSDKSLMRNFFSYFLYNKMGNYASRMRYCDVIIDGEYQGIYLLGEKIKRDNNRVDIRSLSAADSTFPAISGGYIFKIDWIKSGDKTWSSNFPAIGNTSNLQYIIEYPKPENLLLPQLNYIKAYVDTFEYVMSTPQFADPVSGYSKYINVASFIDYAILEELAKNVDGYRLSMFFNKDRNGKIVAGPPWDFDIAWGNVDYMECFDPAGWSYDIQANYTNQCPFWWPKLYQDTNFTHAMRCRWEVLKQTVLNPVNIKNEIDSIVAMLGPAVDVNFEKWPILGVYVWPNPSPIPEDYPGEVYNLKKWVDERYAWLDANIPGECPDAGIETVNDLLTPDISIYPNPNDGSFSIISNLSISTKEIPLEIYSANGNIVWSSKWDGSSKIKLPENTGNGLYLLKVTSQWSSSLIKFIISR
jgi:subtilisin-like proprotein convertase family protein